MRTRLGLGLAVAIFLCGCMIVGSLDIFAGHTAGAASPKPLWSVRISAGGGSYIDSAGNLWLPDTGYVGGWTYTTSTTVAHTKNQAVYQSERAGMSAYNIAVPYPGTYTVRLHEAELWFVWPNSVGKRVFSVTAQDAPLFSNIDLVSLVGADTAIVLQGDVNVAGTSLNLGFSASANSPKVDGIEVVADTPPPTSAITSPGSTSPGSTPTTAAPVTTTTAVASSASGGTTSSTSGGTTTTSGTSTASPTGTTTEPTYGLLAIDGGFSAASNAGRYGYVVLNAWDYQQIPALKAANPGIKVLEYKDASSVRTTGPNGDGSVSVNGQNYSPTGVTYGQAQANSSWFLTDSSGSRLQESGWPGQYWTDVGNPAYQSQWLTNVESELKANGWDGVEIDNASNYLTQYYGIPAKYPTVAAYTVANQAFSSAVFPPLAAAGFLALPNLGGGDYSGSAFGQAASVGSGAMREFWCSWGSDVMFGGSDWNLQMAQMDATQAAGKFFMAVTYGTPSNVNTARYVRASFLLGWNGGPSFVTLVPLNTSTDPWSPEWTLDIGTPLAPRYQVAGGVWRRDFTGGSALVNPSTSASVVVNLGTALHLLDGTTVTSVTLGPTSGLTLKS